VSSELVELTAAALRQALAGRPVALMPPLDLSAGTGFQQRVWAALARIPLGETRSYAEVAADIGEPLATRAVGGACGANPVPVLIPCHRVLRKGGALGGFTSGTDWKRRLLDREKGDQAYHQDAFRL
jgi:O-6-methylguanine DNA methyltransferase